MSYKVVRANEAYKYEAPGHFDVRTTRLHNPEDVNDGRITMGLSHFLPGGGAEMRSVPSEFVYYIVSGEMTVYTEDGEYVLKAGDTIHGGPNTPKAIKNNGIECAKMLVILVKP